LRRDGDIECVSLLGIAWNTAKLEGKKETSVKELTLFVV
jgi:hypothetical protein